MFPSFVPAGLLPWLRLFSAFGPLCTIFYPLISRRLKKAADDRKKAEAQRYRMHIENQNRMKKIEDSLDSVDTTLKIQNGSISQLKTRVHEIELHIWDGVNRRRESRPNGDD